MQSVSIHTPMKGVTWLGGLALAKNDGFNPHTHEGCDSDRRCSASSFTCFNPHTHEGCDSQLPKDRLSLIMFQSTHPWRVWHVRLLLPWLLSCFNPHTHEGCDHGAVREIHRWRVSIHTPMKGVTVSTPTYLDLIKVSIHTPMKGVTTVLSRADSLQIVSIHTPMKGVTDLAWA